MGTANEGTEVAMTDREIGVRFAWMENVSG
jgi:hypothetical protein